MTVYFITHPSCTLHTTPSAHPECPERLPAIEDQLMASGIDAVLHHREAPAATWTQLLRVHTSEYLETLQSASPGTGHWVALDQGDTLMGEFTLEAAYRAAGAAVMAVDLVMARHHTRAFCCVRPPGHHAGANYSMGFCIFNNIAVAAAHALAEYGLTRVAIIDFDVHHGNGTEDIFRDEERILFCSTFQHPFYPHLGTEPTRANIVNLPLPRDTDGAALRAAIEHRCLPALEAFRPELVMISAGFDGHLLDDMGQFRLVEADYAWLTGALVDIAERHAHGRIVSVLEGGYDLPALARSVTAHVKALCA